MKLSTPTKYFHSIVGLSMISLLAVGIYMTETETYDLYDLHKSFGVIVLVIALMRALLRVKEGWPQPTTIAPKIQQLVSKIVHWGLIVSTILYPVSGVMMSAAGGHGISVFGLEIVASNTDPATGEALALNQNIAALGHEIHGQLTWILIALIILHVMGALKHHFFDKDETLKRMFMLRD